MLADNKPLNAISIYLNRIFNFSSILEKLAHTLKPGEQLNSGDSINHTVSVLLADDDIDDRELFENIVREIHANITVNTVEDGKELMSRLTESNGNLPDLLFLDLNMPGKSGKQCLQEIRANAGLKHLPVIIYSTSSHTRDIKDTYSMGANFYFIKDNSFSGALSNFRKVFAIDFENMKSPPDIGTYIPFYR